MNYSLTSYRYTHIVAFFLAAAIHVALAGWIIQPQQAIVIPQNQIIQISMVAPTITKDKKVDLKSVVSNKIPPKLFAKDKAMVKVQKEPIVNPKNNNKEKVEDDIQIQQFTSGLASPDATNISSAITKPIAASYLNNPTPLYPQKARLYRQQGTVLLNVRVQKNGKPKKINIAKSSGYQALDLAALRTVQLWKFVPARQGNKLIEANVEIPITFKIN